MLAQLLEAVGADGLVDYCTRFSSDIPACEDAMKSALAKCLIPAGEPAIVDSAAVRPEKGAGGGRTRGGWVLRLSGRTMDGQQYLSDFFVTTDDQERPRASIPVFWTGVGLSDAPFLADSTRTPQNACPGPG